MPNVQTCTRYFAGLDIGPPGEFTALAVVEQTYTLDLDSDDEAVKHYAVRHLHRFAVGTPYAEVCDFLRPLFAEPPLKGSPLVVDQTAVGGPVVRVFRAAEIHATVVAVTLAAGHGSTFAGRNGWLVGKTELISTVQVLLQSRRFKIAPNLPDAELLVQELTNFKMNPTLATTDPLAAWREGQHDDLVFAAGLAVWEGERYRRFKIWFA